jgi:NADH dehydrogenase
MLQIVGEPPRPGRVCAITGTNGYVGSRIANWLAGRGWEIRAFARQGAKEKHFRFTQVPFDLAEELAPDAFDGVDALVHPAYDFDVTRWSDIERVNVEGSRRLFARAKAANVDRMILVSTLAAFPGARSNYGRAKLEIERAATDVGAAIVRPGLVWGPEGAAMFGALRSMIERLPMVPLFVPPELQLTTVHEDDLALLVERLLELWPQGSGELFVAASPQTLGFLDFLRGLARQTGRRRRFVGVPWRLAWLGLRTLEALGRRPPFRSDSLVSFVATDDRPFARATDRAERYGVAFRPYGAA